MILSILAFLLSAWLLFSIIKIAIKVAWCFAKIIAYVLCIAALPLLIILALSVGGLILLLPVGMLIGAWCLVKSC